MTEVTPTVKPGSAGGADPMEQLQRMVAGKDATLDATLPAAERAVDQTRIPELPEVMSVKVGRALNKRLTDEQSKMAREIAGGRPLQDILEIDSFGSEMQNGARSLARDAHKFLKDEAKASDLGEVGALAQAMNRRFKELGLGEFKWWEKLISYIPFVKVDKLQQFIDGRQSVQELMGEIRMATMNKAVEVELFYNKLAGRIKDVKQTVAGLTVVGAVVELKITETEEKYRLECDRLKKLDRLDDEDLEHIHGMKQTLSALDMKLAHVKAMRAMLRQSGETFRMLREGMGIGITKLKNQIEIQDIVWTVKIDEAIAIREQQKLNEVVQATDEFTNQLVDINLQNLDTALRTIFAEAGKPGVSVALLQKAAQAQKVLGEAINQAFVDNRKKLAQASAELDNFDAQFAERGQDLQTLMKMLEVANMDVDETSSKEAA